MSDLIPANEGEILEGEFIPAGESEYRHREYTSADFTKRADDFLDAMSYYTVGYAEHDAKRGEKLTIRLAKHGESSTQGQESRKRIL